MKKFSTAKTIALCLLTSAAAVTTSHSQQSQKSQKLEKSESKKSPKTEGQIKSKKATVTINGKPLDYTVTAAELTLKTDDDKPRAKIFYTSYTAKPDIKRSERPVLFAFNDGPGSSAVWLHLGALGPKIVPSSDDGTRPLQPPVTLQDNPHSILDVADLVFIDPVSTGYSRVGSAAKSAEFHSVDGDIQSVGDFIRRWISENKRWSSPKYLLGESYGGVRAAGLSSHLQSRYGMHLNGVVLLSGLLDYRTLNPSDGNDLSYVVYLPSLTATAHHHGKIQGDRDQLVAEAKKFAETTYNNALIKGYRITPEEADSIAQKLSDLTSLPKQLILDLNLRIHPTRFRIELLKDQQKALGRFDARVAWETNERATTYPDIDPSFAVAKGAFSTAMQSYLTDDLDWEDARIYEILTGNVHPWKYNANNSYVNMASNLEAAIKDNPKLKILTLCGHTDLATPAGGILHSLDHLRIPPSLRKNLTTEWYEAGHMFYLNQPDLIKLRKDLLNFINNSQ